MRNEPHQLVFVDETAVTTKLTRLRGRSLRGMRLTGTAPFGHWKAQTFIAGLRCHELTAPWIVDGTMDRTSFGLWLETQLAPTLTPGDVVILDSLGSHKGKAVRRIIQAASAHLVFLPPSAIHPIKLRLTWPLASSALQPRP